TVTILNSRSLTRSITEQTQITVGAAMLTITVNVTVTTSTGGSGGSGSGGSAGGGTGGSPTGQITATPNPCMISFGSSSCITTVSWSAQNVASAEVWVQNSTGGAETLFQSGLSGTASYSIQVPPTQYIFSLYAVNGTSR